MDPKNTGKGKRNVASPPAKISPPPAKRLAHMSPAGPAPKKQRMEMWEQRDFIFETVKEALAETSYFCNEDSIRRIANEEVTTGLNDIATNYVTNKMTFPQLMQDTFFKLQSLEDTVDAQSSQILKLQQANTDQANEIDTLRQQLDHRK